MWVRLAWIDHPSGKGEWCSSHLSLPFAIPIDGRTFKIFFSSRDSDQRSHIGSFDLDIASQKVSVNTFCSLPLLSPGMIGSFDEHGVSGSYYSLSRHQLTIWNFGWKRLSGKAWINSIGIAKVPLGLNQTNVVNNLAFASNSNDTHGLAYPYITKINSKEMFFYASFDQYGIPSENEPYSFTAKSAEILKDFELSSPTRMINHMAGMSAQSRPCIIQDGNMYRAWVSVKGTEYEICSMVSTDGINWTWDDSGNNLQAKGLGNEKEQVCYSHVVEHGRERFMFYNGDGFGMTGIGIAKWSE